MDISELTLGQINQIRELFGSSCKSSTNHPYPVGKNVFIRTVTYHHVGRLVEVTEHELVLEDASWIASSGRFADALKNGTLDEVEPWPAGRVIVGRGAIVDCAVWNHALPREQK